MAGAVEIFLGAIGIIIVVAVVFGFQSYEYESLGVRGCDLGGLVCVPGCMLSEWNENAGARAVCDNGYTRCYCRTSFYNYLTRRDYIQSSEEQARVMREAAMPPTTTTLSVEAKVRKYGDCAAVNNQTDLTDCYRANAIYRKDVSYCNSLQNRMNGYCKASGETTKCMIYMTLQLEACALDYAMAANDSSICGSTRIMSGETEKACKEYFGLPTDRLNHAFWNGLNNLPPGGGVPR